MVKKRPLNTVLTIAVAKATPDKLQTRKIPSGKVQENTSLSVMTFLICQIDYTTTRMEESIAAIL